MTHKGRTLFIVLVLIGAALAGPAIAYFDGFTEEVQWSQPEIAEPQQECFDGELGINVPCEPTGSTGMIEKVFGVSVAHAQPIGYDSWEQYLNDPAVAAQYEAAHRCYAYGYAACSSWQYGYDYAYYSYGYYTGSIYYR